MGGDVLLKGCSHGTAYGAVGLLEDSYLERYTRLSVIRLAINCVISIKCLSCAACAMASDGPGQRTRSLRFV